MTIISFVELAIFIFQSPNLNSVIVNHEQRRPENSTAMHPLVLH